MVTTLSDLIEMIERGTVPIWLRNEILAKSAAIEKTLRTGGLITLEGPNGEKIDISSATRVAPAA
jgi:hypothetical protein